MSLTFIATLPESMTVTDVVSYDVTSTSLPQTILARRSGLDELVYDADSGFSDSWKGFSSLTSISGGFTLVLGRRAFSAAGVAVFFAAEAGGGGGTLAGDVTGPAGTNTVVKVQGVPIAAPVTTGNVPHFDGTNIVWGAPSAGSGDVVGPSSAVDGRIALFDTTTGKLLKQSSETPASILTAAESYTDTQIAALPPGSAPAFAGYAGHVTSGTWAWNSLSWADFFTALTAGAVTDDFQVGVTRSGSSFTFAAAGYYHFNAKARYYVAGGLPFFGVRLRRGTTTILNYTGYPGQTSQPVDNELDGIIHVSAGDVVTLQYVKDAAGTVSSSDPYSLDGEAMTTANVSFVLVGV